MEEKPHYENHRDRLKSRYKKGGRNALANYEILELLLTYAIPRKDVKPIAKSLINSSNNSLKKVFDMDLDHLTSFKGIGEHSALLINLVKDIVIEYFEPSENNKITLSSPDAVSNFIHNNIELNSYLKAELGSNPREFFMLVCLNSANQVIYKEVLFLGTLDQAQVYPREIIKLALIKNSSAIILVHNHPSGNSKPSSDDLLLTDRIEVLAKEFGIRLHDHIIISSENVYSIKAKRFIN